jgi:ATP-dependent 26S proteasome regulatory subunit
LYEIKVNNTIGIYFENCPIKTENIIRFPETNSEIVLKEIERFWESEATFKHFELSFKRGVLLWGPPGSGKTSTIMLIMEDILKRDGVVIKFSTPSLFQSGLKILREIEPSTPCVILMEDIDSILEDYRESEVINLLDGVDTIPKIVFLATTNYPEKLGARILNRPSRFDKRYKIGMPNAETRRIYFNHLFDKMPKQHGHNIDKWVVDTEHFSIAHLKELFIAVIILENEYEPSLQTLKMMCKPISSSDKKLGFDGY